MQTPVTHAVAEGASDIAQMGFELREDGLKNSSYAFIEHVLTETVHNGAHDSSFD